MRVLECPVELRDLGLQRDLLGIVNLTVLRNTGKIGKIIYFANMYSLLCIWFVSSKSI